MIGDAYFRTRGEVANAIEDLRSQAEDLGVDVESLIVLDNLRSSLQDPFVFVVVGEVNVGKSTFLNALFGQDFSQTGVVPTTDKVLFFKYGPEYRRESITPTLDEIHVPNEFLKNFHIVDTPGTHSIDDRHQQITERFVPVADLVIFVFSASNPWGASAWKFLERVHREWMRNVIFVLQQCDLRTPEEIDVITDYMQQLAQQRFGRVFPLFPVSAKQAFLARSSGIDRERLLSTSGFDAVEAHISEAVTEHASRRAKLQSALQYCRQTMESLKDRLRQSMDSVERKSSIVQELISERELQLDRTLKKVTPAIAATLRDYHESAVRVASLASYHLSTKRAFDPRQRLTEDDDTGESGTTLPSLDHKLFQDIQHHNHDRWRQVAFILDEDVRHFERFMHSKGKSAFPPGTGLLEPSSEEHHLEMRRHFTARVDSAIRRFVVGLELDLLIEPGFQRAVARAKWVHRVILPTIGGMVAAWYLQGWQAAVAVLATGILVATAFAVLVKACLNTSRRLLIERLEQSAPRLQELLSQHVTTDVEAAFAHFIPLLEPAAEIIQSRETKLLNRTHSLKELETRIAALDQRLRSTAQLS